MGTNIRTSVRESNPFYISKHEYLMARHFALLYPEWRQRRAEIETRVNYGFNVGEGRNDTIGHPVEKAAEAAETYSARISLVEQSAKIAGGDIWEYVLLGVTTECNYEYLRLVKHIPCCKDVYYRMYRKFYWVLNHEICNLLNGKPIFYKEVDKNEQQRNFYNVGRPDQGTP